MSTIALKYYLDGSLSPASSQPSADGAQPAACEVARKVESLPRTLISYQLPKAEEPLFTSIANGAPDCDADYSYVVRQIFNTCGIDSPLFSAMGSTTSFNAVTGAMAACKAWKRIKTSEQCKDHEGKIDAQIDFVRGVTQSAGGACYVAYRPLSMWNAVSLSNPSTVQMSGAATAAMNVVGTVGNSLFGVFYAAIAAMFARATARVCSFKKGFFQGRNIQVITSDVKEAQKSLEFLKSKYQTSPKIVLDQLLNPKAKNELTRTEKIRNSIKARIELENSALKPALAWISNLKALGVSDEMLSQYGLTREDLNGKSEAIADKIFQGLDSEVDFKKVLVASLFPDFDEPDPGTQDFINRLNAKQLLGLGVECAMDRQKKDISLGDIIGSKALGLLKQAVDTGLSERLNSDREIIRNKALEEVKELFSEVKSGINWNLFINIPLLISSVVGFVATILTMPINALLTAPFVIATNVMFQLTSLTMLVPDMACLKAVLSSDGPVTKMDKKMILSSTLWGFISLAAVITLGSVFSMGTLPLAVAIAIGVFWLASNVAVYIKALQKEKRYQMNHPTIDALIKLAEKGDTDEFFKLFKNLSKEDRQAVKMSIPSKILQALLDYVDNPTDATKARVQALITDPVKEALKQKIQEHSDQAANIDIDAFIASALDVSSEDHLPFIVNMMEIISVPLESRSDSGSSEVQDLINDALKNDNSLSIKDLIKIVGRNLSRDTALCLSLEKALQSLSENPNNQKLKDKCKALINNPSINEAFKSSLKEVLSKQSGLNAEVYGNLDRFINKALNEPGSKIADGYELTFYNVLFEATKLLIDSKQLLQLMLEGEDKKYLKAEAIDALPQYEKARISQELEHKRSKRVSTSSKKQMPLTAWKVALKERKEALATPRASIRSHSISQI